MVKMRLLGVITIAALAFTGCSYKINGKGGLEAHKVVSMNQSKFMPTKEQMDAPKTKVVIFPIEDKAPQAKAAGAGQAATGLVQRYVIESGATELVDRNAVGKLKDEIALIEMQTDAELKGPRIADYAVMGEINSVSTSSFYWPTGKPGKAIAMEILNQFTGRNDKMPAENEYTAKVKGQIKIYQLPGADLVKTIELDDDKSLSKVAGIGVGALTINGIPTKLSQNEENGLIVGASTDAVESARHELKNFFAEKGYILEKRVSADGKDAIFLITMGTASGIKEGDELQIFTQEERESKRSGKMVIDETHVGAGKVADIVKNDEAWIHIGNKEIADKLKMGDFVKLQSSKGFGDYAKGVGKFMF